LPYSKKIDSFDDLFHSNNKYRMFYNYVKDRYTNEMDILDNPYQIFYGLPFYRFDLTPEQHLAEYDAKRGKCCFNHFIGLPEKHNKRMPLFPYQKILWDDFEKSYNGEDPQRLFAVLKATGLGITEFSIRIMAWLAVSSGKFRGKRFAIIAGIRMDISEEIIRRLIGLFDRFPFLNIKQSKSKTIINNVIIDGYPADNVNSLRSFHNLAFILVDEADFFRKSLQKEIRTVIERYVAKTNPFVYLVSTPDKPYGLFYELFREQKKDDSIYKLYEFNYEWGLGTIFTKKEIKDQMRSPSFQQEYNLQFGGTVGNLISEKALMKNIYTAEQATKLGFAPYYWYKDVVYDANTAESDFVFRTIGVDTGFGSNPSGGLGSYTGICMTQWRNNRVEIMLAQELRQPDMDELVDIVSVLAVKTNTSKIFVDGSNPPFVRALKNVFHEYPNYGKYDKKMLERKMYHGDMIVCPISFNKKAKTMLFHLKEVADKGLFVIHEDQRNIIECLKSAYVVNDKLDKEQTAHDDLFDAIRLAIEWYEIEMKVAA